ncbi:hypothetical protein PV328_010392 [Microctonus aethiopoides]|uniref:Uncharacterized protein n=1 Tax=Microctonus aethiopoides TaxID=144406 RepID=A0AA39KQ49_9HYME|nr:hypothetical protein PV328_010392 [Microctonus aethiopoides]
MTRMLLIRERLTWYFEHKYLIKCVYRFKDSICDLKNSLSSKENEKISKPLQNVVSNYTIKELANAGASILKLQEKYKSNERVNVSEVSAEKRWSTSPINSSGHHRQKKSSGI